LFLPRSHIKLCQKWHLKPYLTLVLSICLSCLACALL
jgi:hypothetical protein